MDTKQLFNCFAAHWVPARVCMCELFLLFSLMPWCELECWCHRQKEFSAAVYYHNLHPLYVVGHQLGHVARGLCKKPLDRQQHTPMLATLTAIRCVSLQNSTWGSCIAMPHHTLDSVMLLNLLGSKGRHMPFLTRQAPVSKSVF